MKKGKIKKKTDARELVGKVLVNLGQILFATLFLGGVIERSIPPYIMMVCGISGAVICIFVGIRFSAKEKKDEEE